MRYLLPLALLLFSACPKHKAADSPSLKTAGPIQDPMLGLQEPPTESKYQGNLLSMVPPTAAAEAEDIQKEPTPKDPQGTPPQPPAVLPKQEEVFGTLSAQLVPHPGKQLPLLFEKKGWQISLTDLAAPSKTPSPVLLAKRTNGHQEELDRIKVFTRCQGGYCVDGLFDGPKDQTLLDAAPSQEELAFTKAQGRVERVIRIASVGFGHVSVFLGRAASDGKKTELAVECATFYRATGERISLYDLLPAKVADPMLREAQDAIQASHPKYRVDARSFLIMGPFPQELHFCALPPNTQEGVTIEIPR